MNLTEMSAIQLLEVMERRRIYLRGDFSCGMISWQAYTPDPGGHYTEDRVRILGTGTPTEAIQEAIENL